MNIDKNKAVLLGGAALVAYLLLRPQVVVVGTSYSLPGYPGYEGYYDNTGGKAALPYDYDNGESEKLLSVNRK